MHTFIINRTFAKRAEESAIGTVQLKGKAEMTLDGVELAANSIEYLVNFALQSLQDSYAGKDGADAKAAFADKLAKLKDGTIGMSTGGVDPWLAIARRVFRPVYLAALEKAGKAKAYKDADAEGRNAMLDAAIEKNRAMIEPMVAEEKARIAKQAETATSVEI